MKVQVARPSLGFFSKTFIESELLKLIELVLLRKELATVMVFIIEIDFSIPLSPLSTLVIVEIVECIVGFFEIFKFIIEHLNHIVVFVSLRFMCFSHVKRCRELF